MFSSRTLIFVLGLAVLSGLIYMTLFSDQTPSTKSSAQQTSNANEDEMVRSTIADKWQWQQSPKNAASEQDSKQQSPTLSNLPFTEQEVFNALQAVRIDEQGDLALDHNTLLALDEALERIYSLLDSRSLAALNAMIREALPGLTGEQVAELVEDYQAYLVAKDEFSALYENQDEEYKPPSLSSIKDDEALYAELQSLRDVHLGESVTEELFRITDANAKLMFDSMKLGLNTQLTPEQMTQQQEAIQARHIEESLNIDNWSTRYSTYLNAKQSILQAGLDQDAANQQITVLLSQHFSAEEREKMGYFDLDKP